jgi:hypothetical protein
MAADTEVAEPPATEAKTAEAKTAEAKAAEPKAKQAKAPPPKGAGKSKDKDKGKDSKKKGKANPAAAAGSGLSIAAHPRAARRVAQAKGWGGLLGFVVGGYLSLPTATFAGAALHALVAGVACYVMVWAGAVFLWRHLVVAELRSRQHEMLQAELARRR